MAVKNIYGSMVSQFKMKNYKCFICGLMVSIFNASQVMVTCRKCCMEMWPTNEKFRVVKKSSKNKINKK